MNINMKLSHIKFYNDRLLNEAVIGKRISKVLLAELRSQRSMESIKAIALHKLLNEKVIISRKTIEDMKASLKPIRAAKKELETFMKIDVIEQISKPSRESRKRKFFDEDNILDNQLVVTKEAKRAKNTRHFLKGSHIVSTIPMDEFDFDEVAGDMKRVVVKNRGSGLHTKLMIEYHYQLMPIPDDDDIDYSSRATDHLFPSRNEVFYSPNDVDSFLRDFHDRYSENLSETKLRSDLVWLGGVKVVIKHTTVSPLLGGSYIELPSIIRNKKCCINIKNEDNRCLEYCIILSRHTKEIGKNPERISKYKKSWFDIIKRPDYDCFPINLHRDLPI